MPMKQTGRLMLTPGQLERVRKIALAHGWQVGYGYAHGSHNQVNRELADGRALFVPLPDPVQRARLKRNLTMQLDLGRDSQTTAAIQAVLTALELADELAEEAAGEAAAEKETE